MSVVGSISRGAVINNLYQNTKKAGSGSTANFGEVMNAAQPTGERPVNSNTDYAKKSPHYISGITAYAKEVRLTSGIIAFGGLEDGTVYSASYDEDSTVGNPIINIRMESKNKQTQIYKVSVNQVDCANATQLEMFALCTHADKESMSDNSNAAKSYHALLYYAQNSAAGYQEARTADDFISRQNNWNAMITDAQINKLEKENKIDASFGKNLQEIFHAIEKYSSESERTNASRTELEEQALLDKKKKADSVPYGYLAKDGVIEYNGVVFVCDEKHNSIHLGDTSNPKDCITVPLSKGGCLVVNRDNIGDLSKAIGMFSPEDVNLIMRAIAQDAKIQQMKYQIEDETSGIGLAESTGDAEAVGSETEHEE